jgi:hypothetical protein
MTSFQTALVALTLVILLVDLMYTRKWIRTGEKIIEQQRAALRATDAPKYWQHEIGGALRIAIENYLNNRLMTVCDVALMRAYLVQWIDSPVWEMNPSIDARSMAALGALRLEARRIRNVADIHRWIHDALQEGHDPL